MHLVMYEAPTLRFLLEVQQKYLEEITLVVNLEQTMFLLQVERFLLLFMVVENKRNLLLHLLVFLDAKYRKYTVVVRMQVLEPTRMLTYQMLLQQRYLVVQMHLEMFLSAMFMLLDLRLLPFMEVTIQVVLRKRLMYV